MAYRIMEVDSFDDDIFYRASCMCGLEDCDMSIELEYDKELNTINLNLYKNVNWIDKYYDNIFYRFWNRLKSSLKILFTGYIKMSSSFTFENENQIKDFIDNIESGIEKIKNNKK